jgi:periplasmic protein TonB
MSKLNLYETSWTNIVFENRNKAYGAYPLRQENDKTLLFSLFMGVLLLASAVSVPVIYNYLNPEHPIPTLLPDLPPAVVVNIDTYVIPETKTQKVVIPEVKTPIKDNINTNEQLKNPEIVSAPEATKVDFVPNVEISNSTSDNVTSTAGTGVGTSASAGTNNGASSPGIIENSIIATTALDKMPEFPGGINKFYSYVGNNFERPDLDSEALIRVSVSFVIEKDGSMTDIRVLKDPGYGLGREAIRVLKSLKTKWAPGILDGKPVRTSYNLPITIQAN